jgi:fatty-acyl-CoA synthase
MTSAVDWVDYNARRYGVADALEDADTGAVTSWLELESRVAATVGVLRDRFAVHPGDRICVLADNSVWVFVLQFAAMRLGAVFVPLNWRLSLSELATLGADCSPVLIAHDVLWAERARELGAKIGARTVGFGAPDGPADLDDLDALISDAVPVRDEGVRALSDPTHILYTSGTTGVPKGVVITAENLAWQTLNVAEVDVITGPGDRLLLPLPLFHAGGLNTLANPILMSGGCVSVLARFDPAQCLELLSDSARGYTHFGAVPTMYQLMTDLPAFATAQFTTARHFQIAGGVAGHWLLDAWTAKGIDLQTHYGGTEMGPAIAAMPRSSARAKAGSCGFPVRHTRLRLVSPEGGDVGVGEIGEIWISGPSVSPGYFENAAATAASFEGEWFRTGDAGRLDDDGFLFLVDRYKDMYKSGGENVFPAEVERTLLEHPDIAEIVVIGVPDPKWGETGVALIVTRNGAVVTRDDVAAYCDGQLARFKIPSVVRTVDALPRNVTGKVVKSEIKAWYLAEAATLR